MIDSLHFMDEMLQNSELPVEDQSKVILHREYSLSFTRVQPQVQLCFSIFWAVYLIGIFGDACASACLCLEREITQLGKRKPTSVTLPNQYTIKDTV